MSLVLLRRQMKYLMVFVWIFVGIFVLGAMFSFNPGGSRGQAATSGVFAKIGGQEVTSQQFQAHYDQVREYLRNMGQQEGGAPSMDMYVRAPQYAYEQILQEYAQAAAAEAAGISVSESEAQAAVDQDVDKAADRLGQVHPEEVAQIKDELRAQADTEQKRRQLLAQRFQDSVSEGARPVEVKVAHVLIKVDKRSNAAALKLAEEVARQARAGFDFAKLAEKYSEDPGSKDKGGEVGWASASPDDSAANPKAPKDPNAAVRFNPEFTAAALMLRKGQVSAPVLSEDGYHVLKALDQRDYQPKPEPPAKPGAKAAAKPATSANKSKDDPKKKEADKIQQYKQSLAQAVAQGIFSDYKRRLEAQVQPVDPWLQGYLLEEKATDTTHPVDPNQKKSLLNQSTADYEKALGSSGEWGAPLAYHIADLYRQNEEYSKALPLLDKWTKKSIDPELFFLRGEVLEKLNRKTDAVAAYKDAIDHDYSNPELLTQIAEKLKPLGRKDLADAATKKSAVQTAKRAEQQKRQQAASQPSAPIQVSTKGGRGAKAPPIARGQMLQVKTGPMNAKTGKPDILSVKQVPDKAPTPASKNTAAEKPNAKP